MAKSNPELTEETNSGSNVVRGSSATTESALRRRLLFNYPWKVAARFFRLSYGLTVEGAEYLPASGPFILALNEYSPIATLVSGWMSIVMLEKIFQQTPGDAKTVTYLQEDLFTFSYFRNALNEDARGRYLPLVPHSADRLALGLLEGYHMLNRGGIVIINPEGDMPWDGRPLPTRHAVSWLGLHTGVPVVPAFCSSGAYDIWPRWQNRPHLRGKMSLRVGKPYQMAHTPLQKVSQEQMEAASADLQKRLITLCYGEGGVRQWAGEPQLNGTRLSQEIDIRRSTPQATNGLAAAETAPVGMSQLLWQCPICGTLDALVQRKPRFGSPSLECQACHTRWSIERVMAKDFRLKVTSGPSDLVGLDMALSDWYDLLKRHFKPQPISVDAVDLRPDEEVYLTFPEAELVPYRPNPLFASWDSLEAPLSQGGVRHIADWESIGAGRLLLTSQRLIWQGQQREVHFEWPAVTAVYMWLQNTLGIRYGSAQYRFKIGKEAGLKWLAHANTIIRRHAEKTGQNIPISPY